MRDSTDSNGFCRRDLLRLIMIAAAYFLAHEIAFHFPDAQRILAAVWPAGGIGLASLLLSRRRLWLPILVVLFIAGFAADLSIGRPALASAGFMTANLAESLFCAWFITRAYGPDVRFTRPREVLALAAAATVLNAGTAVLGAGTAALTSHSGFGSFWQTWWISDGLGILLVTPLLISWLKPIKNWLCWRWQRTFELLAFVLAWCTLAWLSFHPLSNSPALTPRPYMLMALLAWPAFRFGQRGVTAALNLLAVAALTSKTVVYGMAPGTPLLPSFIMGITAASRLLGTQIFLAFAGLTGMLLAASKAEADASENKLGAERTFLKTLFQNIPDMLWLKSPEGTYLACNARFERGLMVKEAEIVGKSDFDIFPASLAETFRTGDRDTIAANGPTLIHESFVPRSGGPRLELETVKTPVRDHAGKLLGVLGIARDVTAQAEEATRRRILIEESKDGIAVLDLQGKLREWNHSFAAMLGYELREMKELSVWDWDAERTREQCLQYLESITTQPVTFETRHRRKDGTILDVEISASGAEISGERLIFCIHRDITLRRQAERERDELQQQAQESRRLESVGVLAGGIAHEYNNLLTVINGYASLLRRRCTAPDSGQAELDAIMRAGHQAAALTQQLLAYGRQRLIRPRPLEVNTLILERCTNWQELLESKILLRTELEPSLPMVTADEAQIVEAMIHLVMNAKAAMPEGGTLLLRTATVDIPLAAAEHHPKARAGRFVVLSVIDSGIGMDERTRQRLFEPFFTTQERARAAGLGLSTVYGIVTQHQGWIEVESAPQQGSTFRIFLPMSEAGETSAPSAEIASRDATSGEAVILVVEDEPTVRALTVSLLTLEGYRTLEAGTADEALHAIETSPHPIQLLISDVVLPGTPGPELARRLRTRFPRLKIMFISGYAEERITKQGARVADSVFLQKPFQEAELLTKVRELLGDH